MDVIIDYTNWRGERRKRQVRPNRIAFGYTAYHTQMQWLVWALDLESGIEKAFAMKDIHSWEPVT